MIFSVLICCCTKKKKKRCLATISVIYYLGGGGGSENCDCVAMKFAWFPPPRFPYRGKATFYWPVSIPSWPARWIVDSFLVHRCRPRPTHMTSGQETGKSEVSKAAGYTWTADRGATTDTTAQKWVQWQEAPIDVNIMRCGRERVQGSHCSYSAAPHACSRILVPGSCKF